MKQRDIVIVPFPFSDQSGAKVRPALIVSNDDFNRSSDDVILCAITSSIKAAKYSLLIDQADIEEGNLYDKSSIKVETILKMQKPFVLKTIAVLKKSTFSKVVALIKDLIEE